MFPTCICSPLAPALQVSHWCLLAGGQPWSGWKSRQIPGFTEARGEWWEGASGPRELPGSPDGQPDPNRCDLEYWRPMADSPGPLSCAWMTLQGSGLASPERDRHISTILPLFNFLLFNAKTFDLGKALLEILQSSHGEPGGGG